MTSLDYRTDTIGVLDAPTRTLVRLSALVAAGSEVEIRAAMAEAVGAVDPVWVEEAVLQSYLFAGFPRALNAAREWRKASGRAAPFDDEGAHFENVGDWRKRGEVTCAVVYGPFYERLRHNIHTLHPALDAWMIVEGYGKVLARPGLDLKRRELCVVAVCAVQRQDRQLHSHLHGAVHAGATTAEVEETLAVIEDMLDPDSVRRYRFLWARVQGK
jgi:4-carboxymuconolactone decarboxylase